MIKQLLLYLKLQSVLFIVIFLVTVLPLTLVFKYSPYQIEGIQYLFLVILLGLKVIFLKDRSYKRKIRKKVKTSLDKELGRPSPGNLLVKRVEDYENAQDVVLGLTAISILFVCVYFNKL